MQSQKTESVQTASKKELTGIINKFSRKQVRINTTQTHYIHTRSNGICKITGTLLLM